ncbi:hypothetical protein CC1G_14647 [Coprinopsis cinerea okayama7|uniref:CID domain-containing protein n=1 Tax=Coprinopsis cinerea (strain Okayama-7 / 130 / ATCC MYA-4618 / FGSC 9003) TaxID=240176 RepID=D6RMI5_COPC7|nr:hypothetical protein CC1G_14647 [Coprinopsis cinerea okayama7\|eukprot:XP_002911218.1 hypothetical protein CC1G_14647 [Coprinopsis cinerea okayama7\
MYGQPAFAAGHHAFHQSPVNGYYGSPNQYQQQQHFPPPPSLPQPPVFHNDPTSFRNHYMSQLSTLVYNSRPIIQNLSMLAYEYSRHAAVVVTCIESHIRKVPPSLKLPAFYLLDAISKNYYEHYARRFSHVVAPLFLQTYSQVDQQTQNKMEEMLLTWRTGSPQRTELFGPVTQLNIERGVWGSGSNVSITKNQVVSELQFAIGQKERALQGNPYDEDSRRKLEVLRQLRSLVVDVGVSQDELRQILNQLHELVKAPPPPPPVVPPAPVNAWQPPPVHYPPPPHSRPSSSAPYANAPPLYPPTHVPHPPPQSIPSTSTAIPSIPDAENINKILDSLKNAGVLAAASTSSQTEPAAIGKQAVSDDGIASAARDYKKHVLSIKSVLSSSEILRTKPVLPALLYDQLPVQCKQCGLRFADTSYGKKKLDDHLDEHFQQNKKANQDNGRGHCRTWFASADDWIRDVTTQVDDGKSAATVSVKNDKELRAMFIVVPPGDEAKNITCPICQENMKSEFLEDDEEWVWRNAIMKDEKIYHATCHAEALSGIAARLRNDATGSSRGATPEFAGSSRSTPPPSFTVKSKSPSPDPKSVGVKRKVETDPTEERISTPPSKKIALSTDS